jgi:RND superfamily putative drug exporter
VLIGWALVMGLLAWHGFGLEKELSTHVLYMEGTETARAHEIAVKEFGGEDTQVAMLHGPPRAVDRQGAALARRIGAIPGTLVISPWSANGTIAGLRPRPGVAAILVTTQDGDAAPELEAELRAGVREPVEVNIAGGQAIANSLRESIESASETGEKLAIPALLIVLLFVCRSLIGATLPILIGGTVVGASKGVLAILHNFIALDPLTISAAAMLGLALGVDYSLLVVSRFRQERRQGDEIAAAMQRTVVATGQSVVPAGAGLLLAMLVASQMLPGIVATTAVAAAVVAGLSLISAMVAAPAILMLAGPRLDRWSLPARRDEGGLAMRWSRWVTRRPPVVLAIVFVLMACAVWAFTLNTKTGALEQLPPDDPGRQQQESIQRDLGAGWIGPLEVVMNGGEEPVTTGPRLRALAQFQRRVERDPGVASMAGFTAFERSAKQLGGIEDGIVRQQHGLDRLDRSLARVEGGADATVTGLRAAAEGAQRLGAAVDSTHAGSGSLAAGLRSTSSGSEKLSGGLGDASEGSGSLAKAAAKASAGAGRLARKVADAQQQADQSGSSARVLKNDLTSGEADLTRVEGPVVATEQQLSAAWQALEGMTSGRADPQYRAATDALAAAIGQLTGAPPGSEEPPRTVYEGIGDAKGQFSLGLYLADLSAQQGEKSAAGVAALARGTARLDRGLRKLKRGSRKLSDGIVTLAGGSENLTPGLRRLAVGAERLSGGLGQIAAGAGGLAGGLGSGAQRSRLLSGGLRRIHSGVERQAGGESPLDRLHRGSPGLFRSGYFYLAGLDGARPDRRRQAGLLVNLNRGGSAGRMLVIPKDDPTSAAAKETTARVRDAAAALGRQTHSEVVTGGWGPGLVDVDNVMRERGPLIRLALSLVTIVILLLVTRSLALALIAAALNLLTVSATFGVLALLFDGSLLGGPGYVDTSIITAAVTLVFGLAIDYEVFVFARIREEYLRTGSTELAIENGLARTAHVITGAALIMCAVFISFAISPLAALRNLGVGLTIAIVIDALVIRFVLVPAAMRALGERSWWIPRWLDRLLPGSRRRPPAIGPAQPSGAGAA